MTFHHVRLHHKPLLGALLLTAMLTACGESDDLQAGQPATGAGKQYVSLTFTMPTREQTSRADTPTGGEDGDGYEQGQDNENIITDAVAFFFQNNGAGVNGDANTPVRYMYFDGFQEYTEGNGNGIDRIYKTKPIPTDLYGEYNVLVVANPGTDSWWTATTTLGAVRDTVITQAWTKTGDDYTNFLMSSAKDATIQISDANNTEATAANTTVDVERMAARVDYKKLGSYTCTDPNYTNATVEIEGAILVNNLTGPGSYAMKRVSTATTGGTINYLGDETLGAGGLPDNWVLDPTTNNKATATFGVSWQDRNASDPNWWSRKATTEKPITKNNEQWNILGYTLENITAPNETKHDYNTAVVFKAKFHPAAGSVPHYQDQDEATFFELGNTLYASMEDLMAGFSGRTVSDMNTALEKCASWDDVETFYNTLRDDDPCGYKLWLKEQIDESKTLDDVKQSLTWTSYMKNVCGYSSTFTNEIYSVTIDDGVESTAAILAKYGTRTYEDATCYYTWWIRHANDGDEDTNGTMEYAIVRNNIYELDVKSIYSLGGYIPNEEEKGFIVNVYVKDWTLLEPERIEM